MIWMHPGVPVHGCPVLRADAVGLPVFSQWPPPLTLEKSNVLFPHEVSLPLSLHPPFCLHISYTVSLSRMDLPPPLQPLHRTHVKELTVL